MLRNETRKPSVIFSAKRLSVQVVLENLREGFSFSGASREVPEECCSLAGQRKIKFLDLVLGNMGLQPLFKVRVDRLGPKAERS